MDLSSAETASSVWPRVGANVGDLQLMLKSGLQTSTNSSVFLGVQSAHGADKPNREAPGTAERNSKSQLRSWTFVTNLNTLCPIDEAENGSPQFGDGRVALRGTAL